ncbi:RecQ family ATP-dependent DNA helicase [Marinomonas mediterranea]|uniref:ATP-dependent DNA helicase RecQ n=1 Tax=Marinomonas mediterranea (strain ATCC 700492 / JCM 21426 / NBRC 103028 / MMB-1) TaxID=717774 RepID=F2K4L4_MARM1|nr:ATP-dependent DNA helicase RecQ [Marinomonas mediterranea]ADZ91407.1 ATP-dependent DNA helicase, RecQ family [Marinomonas mediterranea MMB-1]WCN17521.1 RecQ family ATP-dependent DNA helicase [Marinomonas mediterranea MMB-1]
MDTLSTILAKLNISELRSVQRSAIECLDSGKDCVLNLPTGSGKSLIYQVASLLGDGVGVVISPLIALMQQQVTDLKANGINARFLNSSLNKGERYDLEMEIRSGHLDIIYLSPEKILQPSVLALLDSVKVSCIAVDEAHCIFQWGRAFRPEYGQLGELKQHFPTTPIAALTATSDKAGLEKIVSGLNLVSPKHYGESVDRPNITLQISQKRKAKEQLLSFILKEAFGQKGIIYCRSRKRTEEISHWLNTNHIESTFFHAALSEQEKTQRHEAFAAGKINVLVATTAYGMGIDIADVYFVAHADLPPSIDAYFQEIGRAGRSGKTAKALLLYGLQDVMRGIQQLDHQNEDKTPFLTFVALLEQRGCRRKSMLAHYGEMHDDCGNCDRCLRKSSEHNVTIAAQKLLSYIYYSKGTAPITAVIQALIGKRTKAVQNNRLQNYNVFGEGKELSEVQWKTLARKLIAMRFVETYDSGPMLFSLTEKARQILRSEIQLIMSDDYYYSADYDVNMDNEAVKNTLRWSHQFNQAGAISQNLLLRIAELKPQTPAALSRLTGLSMSELKAINADALCNLREEMN